MPLDFKKLMDSLTEKFLAEVAQMSEEEREELAKKLREKNKELDEKRKDRV